LSVKTKMFGTFTILAVVAGIGFYANRPEAHTANGQKSGREVTLIINFSNPPRDPGVHIAYTIGPAAPVNVHADTVWKQVTYVSTGTRVELGAKQVQTGALFCSIREGEKIWDWDHNLDGRDWVLCKAVIW
jgi:hypothetical protein